MPDTTPVTGLHTPITNIVPTESTVVAPMLSAGSVGFGDEFEMEADTLVEAVPRLEMLAAWECITPEAAPQIGYSPPDQSEVALAEWFDE